MGRELEAANSDEENERMGVIADKLKVGVVNGEGREQTWRPKTREKLAMVVVPTMLKNQNLKNGKCNSEEAREKQMKYRCMDQVGS